MNKTITSLSEGEKDSSKNIWKHYLKKINDKIKYNKHDIIFP
jgi:hypothetical protein